ncbi:SpoIIE family protein phosphatase [bacterium]|nr:SpoIIE family protein phosphatase [bacterium]
METFELESDHGPANELVCMEIVGGIGAFEGRFRTPAIDFWISTKPYRDESTGGDLHYVSLCGGGVTTRMLLADVSGHGSHVQDYAEELRRLVKRHINAKAQSAFMESMNRGFAEYAAMNRFATAVAATWLGPQKSMELCIAGHPRPLVHRSAEGTWQVLGEGPAIAANSVGKSSLPVGIDEDITFETFEMWLSPGDTLFFYTDSLIESRSPEGAMLGEAGLLTLAQATMADLEGSAAPGANLLKAVSAFRGGAPADDDETLIVARIREYSARPWHVGERVKVFGKFFGLIDY